jgi:hypothetical protein
MAASGFQIGRRCFILADGEKTWIFGSDFELMGLFRWNGNKLKQFLYLIKSFWKMLLLAFNIPLRLQSLLAQMGFTRLLV